MRVSCLLFLVLACALAHGREGVESPPLPCKDHLECLEMVRNATLEKEKDEISENGFPWHHLFWVIASVIAFCSVLLFFFCAAKYTSKSRKKKRTSTSSTLGGGIFSLVGYRRTTTTESFSDVATETESSVLGRASIAILPDAGRFFGSMLPSDTAATNAQVDAAAIAVPEAALVDDHVSLEFGDEDGVASLDAPACFCAVN